MPNRPGLFARGPSLAGLAIAIAIAAACGLDREAPAPYLAPPEQPGACGTTETLFEKLLTFVREEKLAPLRLVLEERFLPSDENPRPDPSLKSVIADLVRVLSALGLDKTSNAAELAQRSEALQDLKPLIVRILSFVAGRIDGRDHYQSAEATAWFVRVCDPDHLLAAIEALLRLKSPSHGDRLWLAVVIDEAAVLLENPFLAAFLTDFQQDQEMGRPAIVLLLDQIMRFLGDPDFDISRVDTLLMSVVYPAVEPDLELRIQELVLLLEEATGERAGILLPLQRAVRCGLAHEAQRKELLGLAYDLILSEEAALDAILASTSGLISDPDAVLVFGLVADLVAVVRADHPARDNLRAVIVTLFSEPDVRRVLPVLLDLLDAAVVGEVLEAVATLLGGCGRVS